MPFLTKLPPFPKAVSSRRLESALLFPPSAFCLLPSLLLCRPDRVGDVIIATSCLEPIRAQRPGQSIVFAAREVMRPLLENHPLLDGFIALPTSGDKAATAALTEQFRALKADVLVQLHPDAASQRAAVAAGIPRRVGYRSGLGLDRTLTDRLPDRRRAGHKHEAEHNFDVLAPLGIQPPPPGTLRPRVHLPESWRRSLRLRLAAAGFDGFDESGSDYAVLNPTAYSLDHRWPPEHWAWLTRELRDRGFERVFLVGESVHDPSARALHHLLGPVPGVIDLSGQTNLAELGWLLRYARVFVSRNTGSTHLAAAVGCPTAELFGRLEPTYGPARWRALGEHTAAVVTPIGPRHWLESRRAFWRRGHTLIERADVLAATLKMAGTRPDRTADAHTKE